MLAYGSLSAPLHDLTQLPRCLMLLLALACCTMSSCQAVCWIYLLSHAGVPESTIDNQSGLSGLLLQFALDLVDSSGADSLRELKWYVRCLYDDHSNAAGAVDVRSYICECVQCA